MRKGGKSLKELLEDRFPDESNDEKKFNNLRQRYYRATREEIGVDEEKIADFKRVVEEFENCYFLDHYGIATQEGDSWRYFNLRKLFGKVRSRIDAVLNRNNYKQKFEESWVRRLTRKKKNS